MFEGTKNMAALDLLHGEIWVQRRIGGLVRQPEIGRVDEVAPGHHDGAFYRVLQLPDVAWPAVSLERIQCLRWKPAQMSALTR